ncbi:hypothetical protein [Bradyrhizobium sp. USDA 4454]
MTYRLLDSASNGGPDQRSLRVSIIIGWRRAAAALSETSEVLYDAALVLLGLLPVIVTGAALLF